MSRCIFFGESACTGGLSWLRRELEIHSGHARGNGAQGSGSNPGGMPVDSGLVESSIGNLLLRGRVIDTQGRPVTGAALMIDNLLVYTDDDGFYNLRERKPHDHELKVLTDQFLGVGKYRVVSAPATIKGTYDVNEPDTVIVVERVPEPHN